MSTFMPTTTLRVPVPVARRSKTSKTSTKVVVGDTLQVLSKNCSSKTFQLPSPPGGLQALPRVQGALLLASPPAPSTTPSKPGLVTARQMKGAGSESIWTRVRRVESIWTVVVESRRTAATPTTTTTTRVRRVESSHGMV
jgi:hypothetical protein